MKSWTLHQACRYNEVKTSTPSDDFNYVMQAFASACTYAQVAIVVETSYRPDGTEDNRIICSYTSSGRQRGGGEIKF